MTNWHNFTKTFCSNASEWMNGIKSNKIHTETSLRNKLENLLEKQTDNWKYTNVKCVRYSVFAHKDENICFRTCSNFECP